MTRETNGGNSTNSGAGVPNYRSILPSSSADQPRVPIKKNVAPLRCEPKNKTYKLDALLKSTDHSFYRKLDEIKQWLRDGKPVYIEVDPEGVWARMKRAYQESTKTQWRLFLLLGPIKALAKFGNALFFYYPAPPGNHHHEELIIDANVLQQALSSLLIAIFTRLWSMWRKLDVESEGLTFPQEVRVNTDAEISKQKIEPVLHCTTKAKPSSIRPWWKKMITAGGYMPFYSQQIPDKGEDKREDDIVNGETHKIKSKTYDNCLRHRHASHVINVTLPSKESVEKIFRTTCPWFLFYVMTEIAATSSSWGSSFAAFENADSLNTLADHEPAGLKGLIFGLAVWAALGNAYSFSAFTNVRAQANVIKLIADLVATTNYPEKKGFFGLIEHAGWQVNLTAVLHSFGVVGFGLISYNYMDGFIQKAAKTIYHLFTGDSLVDEHWLTNMARVTGIGFGIATFVNTGVSRGIESVKFVKSLKLPEFIQNLLDVDKFGNPKNPQNSWSSYGINFLKTLPVLLIKYTYSFPIAVIKKFLRYLPRNFLQAVFWSVLMYSLALEIQNQLIGLNHSLDKFVKHNFIGDENSVEELESIIDSPWYNYFQLHVDIAYAFMHLVFTGFPLADETFRVLFGYLEEEHLNKLPDAIESEDISDVQASTAADERPRRESYCERITNLCCSFLRTKSNQERTPLLDTASTTSSSDLEEGESKGCCKSRGPSICILS